MKNKEKLEEIIEKEYSLIRRNDFESKEINKILLNERRAFIKGVRWQQEQEKKLYSEEEVLDLLKKSRYSNYDSLTTKDWFEQFKKK